MISKLIFLLKKTNRNGLKAIKLAELFKTNSQPSVTNKDVVDVIDDIFNSRDIFISEDCRYTRFASYLSSLKFKERSSTLVEFSARLFIKFDNSVIGFDEAAKYIQEVYKNHFKK
jgi:hypothetical protein